MEQLTRRIQNAGTEVVEAKAGAGSATLSMAFAGARFVKQVLRSVENAPAVLTGCAYGCMASSTQFTMPYFALPLQLSRGGFLPPKKDLSLNDYETHLLDTEVKVQLLKDIEKGLKFAKDFQQ